MDLRCTPAEPCTLHPLPLLQVRHYVYAVHASRTFVTMPTLASSLYLLLLRFVARRCVRGGGQAGRFVHVITFICTSTLFFPRHRVSNIAVVFAHHPWCAHPRNKTESMILGTPCIYLVSYRSLLVCVRACMRVCSLLFVLQP